MATIDLHIHSNYSSDAEFPPATLVSMAQTAGIRVMAVADHNRAGGVGEARAAGRGVGVEVIPAIELDCRYQGTPLHLLGYGIDHADPRYAALWDDIRGQEQRASGTLMDRIEKLGIVLDRDAILASARDGVVIAELVARIALADPANRAKSLLAPYFPGGGRSDNPYVNFYWDYCSMGKPAHVESNHMDYAAARRLVVDTGGVPVLAHPGMSLRGREGLLVELAGAGLLGVEAFSSYHSAADCARWLADARRLGLFVTCGSDFHGDTKPAIKPGGHGGDAAVAEEGLAALRAAMARAAG